jgi:hypothetical protein
MQAWIDLLLIANHDEKDVFIRGNKVTVHRGEIAYSSENLAQRWKWSRGKVLRFLDYIEDMGMIVQQKSFVISTISICNYEKYQGNGTADDTTDSTADDTADGQQTVQQIVHKQEYKKKKKEKEENNISPLFVPPAVDDVAAYCQERNNGVDAVRFVSYYESVGWKVGKNKMKDWKAAVRTWERKDKQEHQSQPPQQQPGCIWSTAEKRWIPI